jgi:hypothetical protein
MGKKKEMGTVEGAVEKTKGNVMMQGFEIPRRTGSLVVSDGEGHGIEKVVY